MPPDDPDAEVISAAALVHYTRWLYEIAGIYGRTEDPEPAELVASYLEWVQNTRRARPSVISVRSMARIIPFPGKS